MELFNYKPIPKLERLLLVSPLALSIQSKPLCIYVSDGSQYAVAKFATPCWSLLQTHSNSNRVTTATSTTTTVASQEWNHLNLFCGWLKCLRNVSWMWLCLCEWRCMCVCECVRLELNQIFVDMFFTNKTIPHIHTHYGYSKSTIAHTYTMNAFSLGSSLSIPCFHCGTILIRIQLTHTHTSAR